MHSRLFSSKAALVRRGVVVLVLLPLVMTGLFHLASAAQLIFRHPVTSGGGAITQTDPPGNAPRIIGLGEALSIHAGDRIPFSVNAAEGFPADLPELIAPSPGTLYLESITGGYRVAGTDTLTPGGYTLAVSVCAQADATECDQSSTALTVTAHPNPSAPTIDLSLAPNLFVLNQLGEGFTGSITISDGETVAGLLTLTLSGRFIPDDGGAAIELAETPLAPSTSWVEPTAGFELRRDAGGTITIDGAAADSGQYALTLSVTDDAGADARTSSVTYAPEISYQPRLFAPDPEAFDYFGSKVAIVGNKAVVTARQQDAIAGKAYLLVRDLDGNWSVDRRLQAADPVGSALLGFGQIAFDGELFVVGSASQMPVVADGETTDVNPAQGSGFIFDVNDDSVCDTSVPVRICTEAMRHQASGAWYGNGTAISEDHIAIGDDANRQVVLFDRSTLIPQDEPYYGNGEYWNFNKRFGKRVVLDGNRMLVFGERDKAGGSAWTVVYSDGAWEEEARLVASDTESGDYFGGEMALDGTDVYISAMGRDGSNGGVYRFDLTDADRCIPDPDEGVVFCSEAALYVPQGFDGNRFGYSLAVSDEYLYIGSQTANRLLVYPRNESENCKLGDLTICSPARILTGTEPTGVRRFGESVAVHDGVIIVGDTYAREGSLAYQGAVYFIEED